MNILVTGATGYVGKALVKRLKEDYNNHVVELNSRTFHLFDRDSFGLSQGDFDLETELFSTKFDLIYHLAVKTEAGSYCKDHPGEQFIINSKINNTILQYWKAWQPQAHFVTFGSSCGYDPNLNKVEANYLEGLPEPGYEVYGHIKRYLLVGLQALHKEYEMTYSYYIPSTVYGPGYKLGDKHFIFELIQKIYNGTKGDEVTLWGDGMQRRNIIYIDDFINTIVDKTIIGKTGVYNLCSTFNWTLKDYATTISNILGYPPSQIKWDTTKPVGSFDKSMLPHPHLINYLSAFSDTPKEGLKETIEYYKEEFHKTRIL